MGVSVAHEATGAIKAEVMQHVSALQRQLADTDRELAIIRDQAAELRQQLASSNRSVQAAASSGGGKPPAEGQTCAGRIFANRPANDPKQSNGFTLVDTKVVPTSMVCL